MVARAGQLAVAAGLALLVGIGAMAQTPGETPNLPDLGPRDLAPRAAGGVAAGENRGGVIDSVHVMAPPGWAFVLETQAGSFVDCGNETIAQHTDADGRSTVSLTCGVTLAETLVIPAAARSARIVIHH
ncbi:MAG: hypothetical protein AAFR29_00075 [Pseudomonadota bacterium]